MRIPSDDFVKILYRATKYQLDSLGGGDEFITDLIFDHCEDWEPEVVRAFLNAIEDATAAAGQWPSGKASVWSEAADSLFDICGTDGSHEAEEAEDTSFLGCPASDDDEYDDDSDDVERGDVEVSSEHGHSFLF